MRILKTQFECQQYLLKTVPRGYFFWTTGVTTREKLDQLAERFAEEYGTRLGAPKRYWRKQNGLANALAVAAPLEDEKWRFYLIANEGIGPIWEKEKKTLKDARSVPVMWGEDYMMRQTRKPREHGGGVHWSWWLTPQVKNQIEKYLVSLAKEGSTQIATQILLQHRRPMHSGIRSQVTEMQRCGHRVWTKCWPNRPWPGPDTDRPLPIVAGYKPTETPSERENPAH